MCIFLSVCLIFIFLAVLRGMWDLLSPTRDWTGVPCSGSDSVLTTESPRKSQPHVLVGWLCVQLQRFIMTPRKGLRWGQKSSCFYRVRRRCLSTFLCVTARLEASGLETVLIPLPHLCSPSLSTGGTFTSWNKSSALITLHAVSYFLITFHMSCPSLQRQQDTAFRDWNNYTCMLCIPNLCSKQNAHANGSVRSCQQLLARTCCECCPMKSLIREH